MSPIVQPLRARRQRPDPPLAEVQVAEEERFFFGFNLYVTVTLLRSINGIPGKSGNARLDALRVCQEITETF